jgi:hypothetical protein
MNMDDLSQDSATIGNRTWRIHSIAVRRIGPDHRSDYSNVVLVNDKGRTGGVTAHFMPDGTIQCAGWDGLNAMTTQQLEPIAELIAARLAWQQLEIDQAQEDVAQ